MLWWIVCLGVQIELPVGTFCCIGRQELSISYSKSIIVVKRIFCWMKYDPLRFSINLMISYFRKSIWIRLYCQLMHSYSYTHAKMSFFWLCCYWQKSQSRFLFIKQLSIIIFRKENAKDFLWVFATNIHQKFRKISMKIHNWYIELSSYSNNLLPLTVFSIIFKLII